MNVTMDTRRHSCWHYQFSVKMCFTLILLMVQIYTSTSHGHSANSYSISPQHFSSSGGSSRSSSSSGSLGETSAAAATSLQRRDIASISVTEVNRSRNLRQTYENNGSKSKIYNEIHPAQSHHHLFSSSDIDNSVERNSTDNRKPAFYACKDYAPKVKEEQPSNTFVIRVDAEDPDEYDTITYSFEKSANERAKFHINEKTGDIETSYTFDRDEPIREKEVSKIYIYTCIRRL